MKFGFLEAISKESRDVNYLSIIEESCKRIENKTTNCAIINIIRQEIEKFRLISMELLNVRHPKKLRLLVLYS